MHVTTLASTAVFGETALRMVLMLLGGADASRTLANDSCLREATSPLFSPEPWPNGALDDRRRRPEYVPAYRPAYCHL